jgi:hypothetical protein
MREQTMITGIELIAEERREQIEKHGRTIERDVKENPAGQLIIGAMNLLHKKCYWQDFDASWNRVICERMAKKSIKERLIIAGALIAAELDRLQSTSDK